MEDKLITTIKTQLSKAEDRLAVINADKAQRIAEIEAEGAEAQDDVTRLRAMLNAATGPMPSMMDKPVQRRSRARRTNNGASPTTDATATDDEVIRLLQSAGPEGTVSSDLVPLLGVAQSQVLSTLKGLEADGKINRTGTRRATRWHLVS